MNQKNGSGNSATTSQKPTNGKTVSTVATIQPDKKEETKQQPKKDDIPSIVPAPKPEAKKTAEDNFYKLDILFSLRDKHEKITESLDKLNKFKLSADGRSDSITFTDSARNTFTTYSPEVLAKTIEALKVDCKGKLLEIEAHIAQLVA